LGLPVENETVDPEHGVVSELLVARNAPGAQPVVTGHGDGVITINVADADDAEREQRRQRLHEPYRTLLGHCRHEIGAHYLQMTEAPRPLPRAASSCDRAAPTSRRSGPPAGAVRRQDRGVVPARVRAQQFEPRLGLPDGYPFVLTPSVVEKLRFVHETTAATKRPAPAATAWSA
jgi:hypothetical protein